MRRDKTNYYLDLAQAVAQRGTCMRKRFGAVIARHEEVIATGYAGAPRGRKNCCDTQVCIREKLKIPPGERYELCRSVHAEANAIISAPRDKMIGSTLYLTCIEGATDDLVPGTNSCSMCKRLIINAGIDMVVVRDTEDVYRVVRVKEDWVDRDESLEGTFGY